MKGLKMSFPWSQFAGLSLTLIQLSLLFFVSMSSAQVLALEEFIESAQANDPYYQKVLLYKEQQSNIIRSARGVLDPSLSYSLKEKEFDTKDYYQIHQAELNLPTAYGLELTSSYSQAQGTFLNPQNTSPDQGLVAVGLRAQLGKGMFYNERTLAIDQSQADSASYALKLKIQSLEYEFKVAKSYLNWWVSHEKVKLYEEMKGISQQYFENVLISFQEGEKSAMDTIEAHILLEDRYTQLIESEVNLQKNLRTLAAFDPKRDWTQKWTPELKIPQAELESASWMDVITENSPELRELEIQKQRESNQLKYKREKFKPKVDLEIRPIVWGSKKNDALMENYLLGLKVEMPLFLREARGSVAKSKLTMKQIHLEQQSVSNQLKQQFEAWEYEIKALWKQLDRMGRIVTSNKKLLDAEYIRLREGESSIFLLNKRIEKLIKSRTELLKFQKDLKTQLLWLKLWSKITQN